MEKDGRKKNFGGIDRWRGRAGDMILSHHIISVEGYVFEACDKPTNFQVIHACKN